MRTSRNIVATTVLVGGFLVFFPVLLSLKAESPGAMLKEIRQNMIKERQEMKKETKKEVQEMRRELKEKAKAMRPTHLVGAKVTANNGSSLTVAGNDGKTYTVTADEKTKIRRHFWGESSLSEIIAGHTVNVWGKFTDDAKTTILATLIRDLSIAKRKGVFMGKVTALSTDGFDVETVNKGVQHVTVGSSTKYVNRKEETIAFADLKVGHRVRVGGVWDQTTKKINEVTEIKDFSLPEVAKSQ